MSADVRGKTVEEWAEWYRKHSRAFGPLVLRWGDRHWMLGVRGVGCLGWKDARRHELLLSERYAGRHGFKRQHVQVGWLVLSYRSWRRAG